MTADAVDDEAETVGEDLPDDVPEDVADDGPGRTERTDRTDGTDATERDDEPFIRYQNSLYRLMSMGGAGLAVVLGVTGIAIGRTLEPIPPAQFFFATAIVAIALCGWYLLGMRCRLDLGETWVHVATKYSDFRIDRDRVVWIDADRSLRGTMQWSGRPLVICYRVGDTDDETKRRRAYGCLPENRQNQQLAIEALQAQLGRPEDDRPERLDQAVVDRLAGAESAEASSELSDAVAARLATMQPEGDDTAR